jgi:hypothetical protein
MEENCKCLNHWYYSVLHANLRRFLNSTASSFSTLMPSGMCSAVRRRVNPRCRHSLGDGFANVDMGSDCSNNVPPRHSMCNPHPVLVVRDRNSPATRPSQASHFLADGLSLQFFSFPLSILNFPCSRQ